MRIKPTEIRLVSSMLAEPAEDADELAQRIIAALDAKREKDDKWVVVYQWGVYQRGGTPRPVTLAYGPFGTVRQAVKAMGTLPSPGEPLAKAMAIKIYDLPD